MSERTDFTARPPRKFLFVKSNQKEASFLTKDLSAEVVHSAELDVAELELKKRGFDAVFVDMSTKAPETVPAIRKRYEVPVFLLAECANLSAAIPLIKRGADGFLLKGVSHPSSLLALVDYASRHEPEGTRPYSTTAVSLLAARFFSLKPRLACS